MNELNILDAGRADCIVCRFDTAGGFKTVVIDGGVSLYRGKHTLLDYLHERQIIRIDLLILTHLHQDHYGGLCYLDEGIRVDRLVAPCGDLNFPQVVYDTHEEEDFWQEYHRAFQYFEQSGTRFTSSLEAAGRRFTFGRCELQCIYPFSDTQLISVETIQKMQRPDLTEEEMEQLFVPFKRYCNDDSSIWTLRCGTREIALLAGDSTESAMAMALQKYPFRPEILKLSHHGIPLKYFSAAQIAGIDPKLMVVTNARELEQETVDVCEALGARETYYTWNGTFHYEF